MFASLTRGNTVLSASCPTLNTWFLAEQQWVNNADALLWAACLWINGGEGPNEEFDRRERQSPASSNDAGHNLVGWGSITLIGRRHIEIIQAQSVCNPRSGDGGDLPLHTRNIVDPRWRDSVALGLGFANAS
jgi:hypothetical protein